MDIQQQLRDIRHELNILLDEHGKAPLPHQPDTGKPRNIDEANEEARRIISEYDHDRLVRLLLPMGLTPDEEAAWFRRNLHHPDTADMATGYRVNEKSDDGAESVEACQLSTAVREDLVRQVMHTKQRAETAEEALVQKESTIIDLKAELETRGAHVATLQDLLDTDRQASEGRSVHDWFELSYAQYLTIPRSVLQSMPRGWQERFVACLVALDNTIDWRPANGRYWVRLKDGNGRYVHDPLMEYRRAARLPRSDGKPWDGGTDQFVASNSLGEKTV